MNNEKKPLPKLFFIFFLFFIYPAKSHGKSNGPCIQSQKSGFRYMGRLHVCKKQAILFTIPQNLSHDLIHPS